MHEQAVAHDRSLEEVRKILSRLDMRRQGGDSSNDLRDYDSRNAQSPASDYDNAGVLRYILDVLSVAFPVIVWQLHSEIFSIPFM